MSRRWAWPRSSCWKCSTSSAASTPRAWPCCWSSRMSRWHWTSQPARMCWRKDGSSRTARRLRCARSRISGAHIWVPKSAAGKCNHFDGTNMKRSADRFLTTHTGSLPRPDTLIRSMFAKKEGVPIDAAGLRERIGDAVAEVVRNQTGAGIDVIDDGEMSKPSYATYIKDRLAGFGGEGNTFVYQDLADFPKLAKRVFGDPGRSRRKTPACNAPIAVKDPQAVRDDVAHLLAALSQVGRSPADGFLTAASPGVVSLFFRNQYY